MVSCWYRRCIISYLLIPLSWLFCAIASLRRYCYRHSILKTHTLPAVVVVVGNITVGGTGKTPLVTAIVAKLTALGYKPGVISRGYGGKSTHWPRDVTQNSVAEEVGDESVLIAQHCGCPMVVGPDRVAAARQLLANNACDVIISDDGLQHYALGREIEIAVIDGERRFGNGFCLPAGPLREKVNRLKNVDFIVCVGDEYAEADSMTFEMLEAINLHNPDIVKSLGEFSGNKVHAVAGIGDPKKFFTGLSLNGIDTIQHPFRDHYQYRKSDLLFDDNLAILMTEKDAVKCRLFAEENMWWVRLKVNIAENFFANLNNKIRIAHGKKIA